MFSQLMRPFSIRGVKTGSEWRPKRAVVIGLYAAVFCFGFLVAHPIAHLALMIGLGAMALSITTIAAIVAGVLLLMWTFDRCVAGRVALSPRLVRALFTEVEPNRQPSDRNVVRLVETHAGATGAAGANLHHKQISGLSSTLS